ncbi:MAG: S9 family peptidase [candidate division Zixibacteria bacterium]|nr:S9 family peptidase [candidate division Zixibacteria bacterium]
MFTGAAAGQDTIPPVAPVIPKIDTVFGEVRVDNYYWLRERDNPQVTAYLEAENRYTEAVMKPTEGLQEKLFEEMRGRLKETDMSVPIKVDSFYYYHRLEEGQQYGVYCRRLKSLDAPEEVLLDENTAAAGYGYYNVGNLTVSHDHRLIAYAVDTAGSEIYTIYFKDLAGGRILDDVIPNAAPTMEWTLDNMTLFYITYDDILRPYRLVRHTLGTDPAGDPTIYAEPDKEYNLDFALTLDKKYFLITLQAIAATEVRYLSAATPADTFRTILPRKKGIEYTVTHRNDQFYIRTNETGKNFALFQAADADPARSGWKEVIPARDTVMIAGLDLFRDYLLVYERIAGIIHVRVLNLAEGGEYEIEFPEPIYVVWPTGNAGFVTDLFRFNYTSLVSPMAVYEFNLKTKQRTLLKQYEVLGGYDPTQYVSERIYARASDGAMVPISMVYKKGIRRDGSSPVYLTGYGAYGYAVDPTFSSNRLSLLDRGFIFAIAHIRGGDEMGRDWYEQGKLLQKMNTFTDFIACAEKLIADGYASPNRLIAEGGSAGGLVMGVIANLRPGLFRIIVANVPFVDVINTMLDESIPLTINEYDEWGNPNHEEYYRYMRAYSPYDNVKAQPYPSMLITGSLNDASVQYWEPAKWTAKLRAMNTGNLRIALKINMGAGHGGASGRYESLREKAFEYAFILNELDLMK